ncbi:MAG: hypothetical protein KJN89_13620 [Gammaproteobacteria bacterium]|nr:hypothetical protein [Gammaproteobacteria bacterium]MBT8134914.1 hypothetical protein [Gammaproteobacteria bacterium]NNJ51410.1 hypothetical protein [Gammaproteobacteria bacterium]
MSITDKMIDKSEKLFKELDTERGNLEVQLHLLGMDAKQEWQELEKRFEEFKTKASAVAEVTEESAGDVGEALKLVAEELRAGYKKIRKSM